MCGNRCSQEICDGLHPDWTGSPKAGKRGSAIWHKRSRARAAKSMVIGERMHGRGYGEYRIVLETGVQHFGARLQTDFGKRGKGEGAARQEDRSERQSMVSRFTAGHGLVQPSFIPPRDIRELRDLTRRRRTLMQQGASERNRVQKILEDANVKIGNVLSDVFGMSGQAMLEALLDNDMTAEQMADLGTRTAAAENSADQRSARGPFDAGSPSPAVATNPEAYGLHRRDGRGTRQRNLAETATLRRRRQTGVFCTRDRTRCCGEHTGRNRNGYERGWPPFPVAIS